METTEGAMVLAESDAAGKGGDSSSSGTALIRDSSDCAETTLTFGGALRSGAAGELGWLRYGEASGHV